MKKEILDFISDILVCMCVGIVIDFFAKTTFIFTIIGLLIGVVLAIVIKKYKQNKKG